MATAAPSSFSDNQQEVYGHDGVTCDPILAIHRGSDSYVTFHCFRDRTQDGATKKVMVSDGAVRVEHLAGNSRDTAHTQAPNHDGRPGATALCSTARRD